MKPIDLAAKVLGVGCVVLAHYLPDVTAYLYFAAGSLLGISLPQLSAMGAKPRANP